MNNIDKKMCSVKKIKENYHNFHCKTPSLGLFSGMKNDALMHRKGLKGSSKWVVLIH